MLKLNEWNHPNYSMNRYLCALLEILNKETDKRIIKKIKKLKLRDAEVFLKKWRRLYCMRRDKEKHLDPTNIKGCNQVIDIIHQEFRHLGIRIP